jgi:hypothetical protein
LRVQPDQITITDKRVYTFAMPKCVYVQVRGVEKALRIQADEAEKKGIPGTSDFMLTIKLADKPVGEFKADLVDGWWIQDE